MKNEASLWYIQGLKLGGRLPSDLMDELQRIGKIEKWGHRGLLTRRPGTVGLILSGSLDVNDGSHVKSPRLHVGDLLGFQEDTNSHELVRAFDETTICSVDAPVFNELVRDHLGSFWVVVGMKSRGELSIPVSELIYKPSKIRLARMFELLADQYGEEKDDGIHIPLSLRSRHFSALTGILNSRIRRILNEFDDLGLVGVGRKSVLIPSPEELAAYGRPEVTE